jgi:O-antigen biosynthesis protein WbqP
MLYARYLKRPVDVVAGGCALVASAPFMAVTAIAIRLEDGGPALLWQRRVGRDGTFFRMAKFRTMPVGTPTLPSARAADLPVTRVGRFLRRTSLDELPQLLNIVHGTMSLVGPRPALPEQEELLALRAANGSDRCRPGLTGRAQVRAYDGMPETEKARLDGEYAAAVGLLADAVIVLKTIGYLVRPPPVT